MIQEHSKKHKIFKDSLILRLKFPFKDARRSNFFTNLKSVVESWVNDNPGLKFNPFEVLYF